MPVAAITPAVATLIAGGAAAGATAYGSHAAGKSAKRAADVTAKNDADTLAYERQHDAQLQAQFDAQQKLAEEQFKAEEEQRQYDRALQDAREARMAPYRAASSAALGKLGGLLGLNLSAATPPPTSGGNGPTMAGTSGGMHAPVGSPMPPMRAPGPVPATPAGPGDLNPYANDFTPRDPRTGLPLRPGNSTANLGGLLELRSQA